MFKFKRRIFGQELIQDVGQAAFVSAACRRDRQTEHGFREAQRLHANVVVFMRGVQNAVKHQFFNLGDDADIARNQFTDFGCFFALKNHWVTDLDCLFVVVDKQLVIAVQGTLMDAEDTDLADVRVINDFEDMSDKRQFRISGNVDVIALFVGKERSVGFRGVGQMADHHIDQIVDTGAGFAGNEADRDDVSFTQGLSERTVQRGGIGRALFKVALHRFVVHFNDLFYEMRGELLRRSGSRPHRDLLRSSR